MKSHHIREKSRHTAEQPVRGTVARAGHPSRWHVLESVKAIRDDLSLNHRDITALRALLSVLPTARGAQDPAAVDTAGLLMIYASNDTLISRADGMNERTLRRAIAALVEAGLVVRHSSSSGKRFPLRRGGAVVGAYGLDLSPLFAQIHALEERAVLAREADQERAAIRSRILADRKVWLDRAAATSNAANGWVNDLVRILRRKLTLQQMRDLATEARTVMERDPVPPQNPVQPTSHNVAPNIRTAVRATPAPQVAASAASSHIPANMSDTDGQTVRHIESPSIGNKKRRYPSTDPAHAKNPLVAYREAKHIRDLFPEEPRTITALQDIVFSMSSYLNLTDAAGAVARIGWYHMVRVLEYLCEKVDIIRSPQAYLRQILATAHSQGTVLGEACAQ